MDAISLVREVSRFSGFNIEPYNDNQIRSSLQSLNRLYVEAAQASKLQEEAELSGSAFSGELDANGFRLLLTQTEIMRSKRCLLAYHKTRLDRIAMLSKELPTFPANLRGQLSKTESAFQQEYSASLGQISIAYGNLVGLNGPLNPPKDLYITVRVVKDCGTVQTEYGPLYLNPNSFHYVRKTDVEHLISQGFLLHIS